MLSRTAIYAVRALSYLASLEGETPVLSREIAEALDLPSHFLAKILGRLSLEGILESSRGKKGGFRLARPSSEIYLLEIVDPFDRLTNQDDCLLRNGSCSSGAHCSLHEGWAMVRESIIGFLDSTSLETVGKQGGIEPGFGR